MWMGFGRKRSWPDCDFSLNELKKSRNISVSITDVQAEIRTKHFPNKSVFDFDSADRGMFLRNVDKLLPNYTTTYR